MNRSLGDSPADAPLAGVSLPALLEEPPTVAGTGGVRVFHSDARGAARALPKDSLNAVITSPPYFDLRSYLPDEHPDKALEIGTRQSVTAYIDSLAEVLLSLWDALRDDGTLWVVMGDCYAGSSARDDDPASLNEPYAGGGKTLAAARSGARSAARTAARKANPKGTRPGAAEPPDGALCGLPWRLARALENPAARTVDSAWLAGFSGSLEAAREAGDWNEVSRLARSLSEAGASERESASGPSDTREHSRSRKRYVLRMEIVWEKANPMPDSARSRVTRAHEQILVFSKRASGYFFDAEELREPSTMRPQRRLTQRASRRDADLSQLRPDRRYEYALRDEPGVECNPRGRLGRSVWRIATTRFSGLAEASCYAAFPPELANKMIRAATPAGGVCASCGTPLCRATAGEAGKPAAIPEEDLWLANCSCGSAESAGVPALVYDPFMGSGTTAAAARSLGRAAAGSELDARCGMLLRKRLAQGVLF